MKLLKGLCIRLPSNDLEKFLCRTMRLGMQSAVKNMAALRKSSAKRSRR